MRANDGSQGNHDQVGPGRTWLADQASTRPTSSSSRIEAHQGNALKSPINTTGSPARAGPRSRTSRPSSTHEPIARTVALVILQQLGTGGVLGQKLDGLFVALSALPELFVPAIGLQGGLEEELLFK